MKSKETKVKATTLNPTQNCPECASGIDPTILQTGFGAALRESL